MAGGYITPGSSEEVYTTNIAGGSTPQSAYDAEYNVYGVRTNMATPLTAPYSANNAGVKDVVGGSESQTTQTPVSSSGNVQSSSSIGYNTGTGWWIGFDGGIPKLFIGNSAGNKITWDGTTLTVSGTFTAGSLNIPDTTTANSFHVDSNGNSWWGANVATGYAGAPAYILNTGAIFGSSVTITGGSITGTPIASIPNSTATDISLLSSSHNLVFSVTDADTIAWSSGTLILSNGRSFSISSGNTGNMAALTYIYLDPATSSTVLQTTTTYSTAMGANKLLLGTAQNNTITASFIPFGGGQPLIDGGNIGALSIVAGNIAASTITAAKLSVSQLSAITADMGALTAGTVTLDTAGYIRGGQTAYNTGTGFFLGYSSAYKFSIGNPAGTYLTWDGSVLTIEGFLLNYTGLTASNNLKASSDAQVDRSNTTYQLVKQITVRLGGVARVKFDLHCESGETAYGRIYLNDVAVGTERSTTSNTYVTYSEDIAIAPFDKVQLYIKTATGAGNAYAENYRIYYDIASLAQYTVDF